MTRCIHCWILRDATAIVAIEDEAALARSESPPPEGLTEAAFRERHRGRSCMGPCHKDTAARLRSSADSGTEGT